jgi:hypothetical protein
MSTAPRLPGCCKAAVLLGPVRSLAAIALLCLGACSTVPHRGGTNATVAAPSAIIYVVRRGWHIDVGVAAADLMPPLSSLRATFPSARYLIFGFGDRHYLLSRGKSFPSTLVALWPGAALVLVTGLTAPPASAFGGNNIIELSVTAAQMRALQAFLWRTLVTDNDVSRPYAQGPYAGSLYFAATARYSALHTCNTWVAEGLQAAQLPIRSRGVVFAGSLWRQVRHLPNVNAAAMAGFGHPVAPDQSGATVESQP